MNEQELQSTEQEQFVNPPARVLPPLGRVPAAELRLWLSAADTVKDIETLCDETRKKAAEYHAREHERGYREGYAAGTREIAKIHVETQAAANAYLEQLKNDLPDMVDGILRKIIGSFEDHSVMQKAIAHAIAQHGGSPGISIRVPEQFVDHMCERATSEERRALDRVPIEIDQSLEQGKCILQSELGMVNLGIEDQLEIVRDYIKEHVSVGAHG